MAESVHQRWSSHGAFLLATAGAAVGLGNIWRFPYLAGEYGGAAFVLVYLAFVFLIGVPVISAELAIGRMGQLSPIGSVRAILKAEGGSSAWQAIGYLSVLGPVLGLAYYSIVAGWSLQYTVEALGNAFAGVDADGSQQLFQGLAGSAVATVTLQGIFIGLTAVAIGGGLRHGIERATKIMMPALAGILLIIFVYNLFAADMGAAITFLFTPDFSQITATSLLLALGQAFFSVGVGVGFMMTYGAYLPRDISVPQAAIIIGVVDTAIALLAGLVIFPIVFASGLSPGEGPGLVFVTMPIAFGGMTGGQVIGILFFLLLTLAAYTTALGMLEPIVSYLEEKWLAPRRVLAPVAAAAIWLLGLAPALSDTVLAGVTPLGFIPAFEGMSVFEVFDFTTGSIILPVNALLIALFAGWVVSSDAFRRELALDHDSLFTLWQFLMRYVAPAAVLAIMISGLVA
ncbi:MAG: sodium-dependent transporter [Dehalococcoidia bacterium]|jgi:NSS family neurotransmitter:Na+ symporter|nr:sodium-dependent transporter [Dehalococcoidia bacterium]